MLMDITVMYHNVNVNCDCEPVNCDRETVNCDCELVNCDHETVNCDCEPVNCDCEPFILVNFSDVTGAFVVNRTTE